MTRTGRPPYPDVLTPAEWRVLESLREGRPNAEIAVRLGISVNTVRYHVSNMLAKLELPDRHALGQWNGRPKRRFGWLPPIALGPGSLGLGSLGGVGKSLAALGAVAAVALVVFAFTTSRGGTTPPRTSVVVTLWDSTDENGETRIFGIDPTTAAPLEDLDPLVFEGRQWMFPLGAETGLLYLRSLGSSTQPASDPPQLTLIGGSALGLASPSHVIPDETGVVRRLTFTDANPESALIIWSDPNDSGVLFGLSLGFTERSELWSIRLETGEVELLTTLGPLAQALPAADGRLFVTVRDPGLDLSAEISISEAFPDFEAAEADYVAVAQDYVVELHPTDGREIDRISPGGAIAASVLTPDGEHLHLFSPVDGEFTIVELDTMQTKRSALPPGGPWPGIWPFGALVFPVSSLDGRHLYLTGTQFLSGDDEGPMQFPALGLRIVNLEAAQVVYQDRDVDKISPSPDGRWLVAALAERQTDGTVRGAGLTLIDADTFQVVAHLEGNTAFEQVVISADSRYAYAVAEARTLPTAPDDCSLPCSVITVIDLDTLEVIAHHSYEGDVTLQVFP